MKSMLHDSFLREAIGGSFPEGCLDISDPLPDLGDDPGEQACFQRARGLTVADSNPIVQLHGGDLPVAEASPDGFSEPARAKVLNGKHRTVPVVAGRRIYWRGHAGEVACVDMR